MKPAPTVDELRTYAIGTHEAQALAVISMARREGCTVREARAAILAATALSAQLGAAVRP